MEKRVKILKNGAWALFFCLSLAAGMAYGEGSQIPSFYRLLGMKRHSQVNTAYLSSQSFPQGKKQLYSTQCGDEEHNEKARPEATQRAQSLMSARKAIQQYNNQRPIKSTVKMSVSGGGFMGKSRFIFQSAAQVIAKCIKVMMQAARHGWAR
jgi:hypothetical protein